MIFIVIFLLMIFTVYMENTFEVKFLALKLFIYFRENKLYI